MYTIYIYIYIYTYKYFIIIYFPMGGGLTYIPIGVLHINSPMWEWPPPIEPY